MRVNNSVLKNTIQERQDLKKNVKEGWNKTTDSAVVPHVPTTFEPRTVYPEKRGYILSLPQEVILRGRQIVRTKIDRVGYLARAKLSYEAHHHFGIVFLTKLANSDL